MAFFCIHCKSEIDPKFKACPYCGEAITDFLRRYLETPIDGKYQILARLGVGGMGEVFKVLHIHLNSIRVIKLMRANIAGDSGANDRFLREARLATKINHPNVATLFDFSTLPDGSFYMVWEYIEGTNLHELIDQRGPLSPKYAARLASQALQGLEAIHRSGIVHRDISPENLMITRAEEGDERVKIIDLGIAKSSSADDNKTKTGMFVGKWKYCSPEHLGMMSPGERIDGRADLYSFGIVLYEMLTGVPPFQADTPHAYLMMHASQQPKPLQDTNPGVTAPPELEAVIFRSLEKDRAKRYQTAREFAQALDQLAPGLSESGGAPPPLPAMAEETDEATHPVPKTFQQSRDVVVDPDAQTLVTEVTSEPVFERSGPATIEYQPPPPKRSMGIVVLALVFVLLVGVGWILVKRKDDVRGSLPAAESGGSGTATPVAVEASATALSAPGFLGINAYPWANVTSIRNLESGKLVERDVESWAVTPSIVTLDPGRYEVTLSNPNFGQSITRAVAISGGRQETLTVHFTDPGSAAVPDFGGSR